MEYKTSLEGPTHTYLNLAICNTTSNHIKAAYTETRSTPVIRNPSEYYLSIVRFQIPADDVPIFIFRPIPGTPTSGNTNPNAGIYTITLSFGATVSQIPLVWIPTSTPGLFPTPTSWLTINENNFLYYAVYSYQHFIDIINNALLGAYTLMPGGSPPKLAGAPAPYLIYNADTKIISLIAHRSFDPVFAGGPTINIYFNNPLYDFFTNFENIYGGSMAADGKNYQILVKNNQNNLYTPPGGAANFYEMKQEFAALYAWNDLTNVVITSTQIQVNPEGTPPAQVEVSSDIGAVGGTTSNSLQILTDFQPLANIGPEFRENLQYFPQGEYRLVDMLGRSPLTNIDLTIYWTDRLGTLFPLYITPGKCASFKILFRKKSFKSGGL